MASRVSWAAAERKLGNIGVQLYTVRDAMKADFSGTIAKVAQVGYKEVSSRDTSIIRQRKCGPFSTKTI